MGTAAYFLDKARQCRRLSLATNDHRTIVGLTAMAEEFEARAKTAEALKQADDLLRDGPANRLTPDG